MEKYRSGVEFPSENEKRAAIRRIADEAFPAGKPVHIPLRTIFFGVGDCVAAGAAAAVVLFAAVLFAVRNEMLSPFVVFVSPALYALVCTFVQLKETALGVSEWRRTCRISAAAITGMRMLLTGALAIAIIVPCDLALCQGIPGRFDPLWMTGLSFSSLVLYALLALALLRYRHGTLVSMAVWAGISIFLAAYRPAAFFLRALPAAILYVLAGAAACIFVFLIRRLFFRDTRPEASYAYNN